MAMNFPLILVILTLVSGLMLVLDKFYLRKKRETDQPAPFYIEYTAPFFPILFLVLVLRSFLVEPFQIPSASMVPTLQIGDFILVNKFSYGLRLPVTQTKIVEIGEPRRGDVMVFFPPGDDRYFIKRVVGLPGDRVQVINNQLFINGERMEQSTATEFSDGDHGYRVVQEKLGPVEHLIRRRETAGRLGQMYSIIVPEAHYFMMGDNRDNSSDSRVWGPVPEERIVGKAFAVWMHWDRFLSLPSFSTAGKIH